MSQTATSAAQQPFGQLVDALTQGQSPRLWSFVVTIFGDLAQDEQARISGSLMGTFVGRLGVKPEALRVALHRLRKEGWLESHKQGRSSDYALSPWGRAQSAQASQIIYDRAALARPDEAWLVLHDPADKARDPAGEGSLYSLSPAASLALRRPRGSDTDLVLRLSAEQPDPIPAWVQLKLCDHSLIDASQDLEQRLAQVLAHRALIDRLSDLDRMVLRVLIVHSWRRLILKAPLLPAFLFPPAWRGTSCAEQVEALLRALPPLSIEELTTAVGAGETAEAAEAAEAEAARA